MLTKYILGHGCHKGWKVRAKVKAETTKKKWIYAFYVCLFACVLAELAVLLSYHPHFWWDEIPGFNAIYGFFSCIILILVGKALGHWLKKEEGYYKKRLSEHEKKGGERTG